MSRARSFRITSQWKFHGLLRPCGLVDRENNLNALSAIDAVDTRFSSFRDGFDEVLQLVAMAYVRDRFRIGRSTGVGSSGGELFANPVVCF